MTPNGLASSRFACALATRQCRGNAAAYFRPGTRGYLKNHRAQRRRAQLFIAIVAPATKQLARCWRA